MASLSGTTHMAVHVTSFVCTLQWILRTPGILNKCVLLSKDMPSYVYVQTLKLETLQKWDWACSSRCKDAHPLGPSKDGKHMQKCSLPSARAGQGALLLTRQVLSIVMPCYSRGDMHV